MSDPPSHQFLGALRDGGEAVTEILRLIWKFCGEVST